MQAPKEAGARPTTAPTVSRKEPMAQKANERAMARKSKEAVPMPRALVAGAQTPTPVESRQCYNCNEWGNIGKDCKKKDRRELKPLERGHEGDTLSQAGSARSPAARPMQLCMMKSRRSAAIKAADNDRLYNSADSCCISSVDNSIVHALPSPAVGEQISQVSCYHPLVADERPG